MLAETSISHHDRYISPPHIDGIAGKYNSDAIFAWYSTASWCDDKICGTAVLYLMADLLS